MVFTVKYYVDSKRRKILSFATMCVYQKEDVMLYRAKHSQKSTKSLPMCAIKSHKTHRECKDGKQRPEQRDGERESEFMKFQFDRKKKFVRPTAQHCNYTEHYTYASQHTHCPMNAYDYMLSVSITVLAK